MITLEQARFNLEKQWAALGFPRARLFSCGLCEDGRAVLIVWDVLDLPGVESIVAAFDLPVAIDESAFDRNHYENFFNPCSTFVGARQ